jgi:hypothetical protein
MAYTYARCDYYVHESESGCESESVQVLTCVHAGGRLTH